jgi:hypothetical protein
MTRFSSHSVPGHPRPDHPQLYTPDDISAPRVPSPTEVGRRNSLRAPFTDACAPLLHLEHMAGD